MPPDRHCRSKAAALDDRWSTDFTVFLGTTVVELELSSEALKSGILRS